MEYDAIVIGAGTAGEGVIASLNGAGMKVAAIEEALVGGLCAYWGCMPSKTLLRPGDVVWEAEHSAGTSEPSLRWPEVAQYRNYIVRNWDDSRLVEQLKGKSIDFFRGKATISGPGQVQVNGQALRSKRIVVATGSQPTIPPIPGLREANPWTNREATELQEVPKSVLVIGGGAVGCELGQAMHHFGAEVTIVEALDHLLGAESPDAAGYLKDALESDGVRIHLGRTVTKVGKHNGGSTVTLDDGTAISSDAVLVATGRRPNVGNLGLESVGITPGKQGVQVDEYCRAGENVWAAGDVTGVAGFTHIAYYQAQIVVDDILGKSRPADYRAIPRVTFTDPEVASVGTTKSNGDVVTARVELATGARTETYGKGYKGGLCLYGSKKDKVLVGAWAVGPLAGEWIQLATLAIRARVPVDVLDDTILAFPTFTRLYLEPFQRLHAELSDGR